jgi:ORMDL family
LYFLHFVKGTPWYTSDILTQTGGYKRETHFEQLDSSTEFSWTGQKKFLFVMPIILFLLTCLYTENSEAHFLANFISLIVVILPKLPSFHHVRILGINKY